MTSLVVRAPNHLGDLLMALPAIASLQPADVLLPRWLVPVLELAELPGECIPFDRGAAAILATARELRRRGYRRGVLLAPSFSAALPLVLAGVRERRGARTDGRGLLITEPVPDAAMAGLHRSATYHVLARGEVPESLPAPRLRVPVGLCREWESFVRAHAPRNPVWECGGVGVWGTAAVEILRAESAPAASADPESADGREAAVSHTPTLPHPRTPSAGWAQGLTIGLFPGSNAESRRWDAERYAELAGRLASAGAQIVVFGGRGERELTARVAGDVAFDAGGRTELPLLAAGLAACDLLVSNDSGPMHLAAAVGTRTVSLQGPSDPRRTRPLGPGHVLVQHAELACVPCVRNECPRRGPGTYLPDAHKECLALITVDELESALRLATGRQLTGRE